MSAWAWIANALSEKVATFDATDSTGFCTERTLWSNGMQLSFGRSGQSVRVLVGQSIIGLLVCRSAVGWYRLPDTCCQFKCCYWIVFFFGRWLSVVKWRSINVKSISTLTLYDPRTT